MTQSKDGFSSYYAEKVSEHVHILRDGRDQIVGRVNGPHDTGAHLGMFSASRENGYGLPGQYQTFREAIMALREDHEARVRA